MNEIPSFHCPAKKRVTVVSLAASDTKATRRAKQVVETTRHRSQARRASRVVGDGTPTGKVGLPDAPTVGGTHAGNTTGVVVSPGIGRNIHQVGNA